MRILIADDHGIVRSGLRLLLDRQPDMEVVAEAATASRRSRSPCASRPDLCVLDVAMPRLTGLQAAREIKAQAPDIAVLILSMHDDERYVFEALQAGASGYVLKREADQDLVDAVRAVAPRRGLPHQRRRALADPRTGWRTARQGPREPLTAARAGGRQAHRRGAHQRPDRRGPAPLREDGRVPSRQRAAQAGHARPRRARPLRDPPRACRALGDRLGSRRTRPKGRFACAGSPHSSPDAARSGSCSRPGSCCSSRSHHWARSSATSPTTRRELPAQERRVDQGRQAPRRSSSPGGQTVNGLIVYQRTGRPDRGRQGEDRRRRRSRQVRAAARRAAGRPVPAGRAAGARVARRRGGLHRAERARQQQEAGDWGKDLRKDRRATAAAACTSTSPATSASTPTPRRSSARSTPSSCWPPCCSCSSCSALIYRSPLVALIPLARRRASPTPSPRASIYLYAEVRRHRVQQLDAASSSCSCSGWAPTTACCWCRATARSCARYRGQARGDAARAAARRAGDPRQRADGHARDAGAAGRRVGLDPLARAGLGDRRGLASWSPA